MNTAADRLIALDGINGLALGARARAIASDRRHERPAISVWDASGIFSEVQLATVGAGDPSARTLLLLYAADLAYRVRAEIKPALDAGRLVIAAPYVDTAVALGHATGLDAGWVSRILSFAPAPLRRELIEAPPEDVIGDRRGLVEFCCRQLLGDDELRRHDLIARTNARLRRP